LGTKQGDKLSVEVVDQTVIFKRIPSLLDLAGIFAGQADMEEIKKDIDKLRDQY
jgi:hypothetical protein